MGWTGYVARMGAKLNGKRPLGRPRHRWEDNINIYLRGIIWNDMDRIYLSLDRDRCRALVNTEMNLRDVLE
jgi:hypothetical protein